MKGTPRKVAIVGGGISGMAAAHHLHRRGVDVTVFERDSALGGHALAHGLEGRAGAALPLGVSLLQDHYVNLFAFFDQAHASVRRLDAQASVCVIDRDIGLELRVSKQKPLDGLLTDAASRRLRFDSLKLLSRSERYLRDRSRGMPELDFRDFLDQFGFHQESKTFWLLIIGMCLIANTVEAVSKAPASSILYCLARQRVLQYPMMSVPNYTFAPHSGEVFRQISDSFSDKIRLCANVDRVDGDHEQAVVTCEGEDHVFDCVILSTTTGPQAMDLLRHDATAEEKEILMPFEQQQNQLILHTDETLLQQISPAATYNIVNHRNVAFGVNDLTGALGLGGKDRYFLSYDDDFVASAGQSGRADVGFGAPDPGRMIFKKVFAHPLVSAGQWRVLQEGLLDRIQGRRSLYFSGSWTNGGEGSHEFAYVSGRRAAAMVLGEPYEPLMPKPVAAMHGWISRALCLADRST